ncbi:MAG: HU family DNA-binding protein [Bacillota bacterium]|nr:HU family DNA-binding protein [Bacillota bacterium]
MNKAELVAKVAEQTGAKRKDVERIVGATLEAVEGALVSGDKVQLVGFGTFEVRERAARMGRNPRTGDSIKIAASRVPVFKAGKALKDKVTAE